MIIAGRIELDTGTLLFILGFFAVFFFLVSLFGGLIAYAIARTKLAFMLGTFTFAATVGFGPAGNWLPAAPHSANRLLEAWLASATVGVALRLAGALRRSPARTARPASSRPSARRVAA